MRCNHDSAPSVHEAGIFSILNAVAELTLPVDVKDIKPKGRETLFVSGQVSISAPHGKKNSGFKRCAFAVVVMMCAMCVGDLFAADTRGISTMSFHRYTGGAQSTSWEQAVLIPLRGQVSALFRAYGDERETWNNRIYSAGAVYVLKGGEYVQIDYGYGADSNGARTDYYGFEATRETAVYTAGAGYKYTASPVNPFHTVSPSVLWKCSALVSLFGKAFVSRDAVSQWNYSYWAEARIFPSRHLGIVSGCTGGDRLLSSELDRRTDGPFRSLVAGLYYKFTDTAFISYRCESLRRENLYDDICQTIVADIRF